MKAQRHISSVRLGPYDQGVCDSVSARYAHRFLGFQYLAVFGNHRLSKSSFPATSYPVGLLTPRISEARPVSVPSISKLFRKAFDIASPPSGHSRRALTLTLNARQKPVPRSNQSLFLSSYTLTLFLSLAGGIARAMMIVGALAHQLCLATQSWDDGSVCAWFRTVDIALAENHKEYARWSGGGARNSWYQVEYASVVTY